MRSRFSPVLIDARSLLDGIRNVSTPYLDAQASVPLLLLVLVRLCDLRTNYSLISGVQWALAPSALILMLYLAALSVRPTVFPLVDNLFQMLQFPYRLTAYINLTALVVFIAIAGAATKKDFPGRIGAHWLAFCLALALAALLTKIYHAKSIDRRILTEEIVQNIVGQNSLLLPLTYYGHPGYSVTDPYQGVPPDSKGIRINLLPRGGAHFGEVSPLEIDLKEPALIVTNVQPFPWNHLMVDGVLPDRLVQCPPRHECGFAIQLGAGRHVLEYRFVPNRIWSALIAASWIVLFLWGAAVVAALIVTARRRQRIQRFRRA